MITVYVLESLKDHIWYTGMCMDIDRRLKEHNAGKQVYERPHAMENNLYRIATGLEGSKNQRKVF